MVENRGEVFRTTSKLIVGCTYIGVQAQFQISLRKKMEKKTCYDDTLLPIMFFLFSCTGRYVIMRT